MKGAWLLPLLMGTTGCYRYADTGRPEPGRFIQVDLTEPGASALSQKYGPGVLMLEGLALSDSADAVVMSVTSYLTRRQGMLSAEADAVRLESGHVSGIREKRFDRVRSALFGAGVVAGVWAMIALIGQEGPVLEEEDPADPGNPRLRIRLPVRVLRSP